MTIIAALAALVLVVNRWHVSNLTATDPGLSSAGTMFGGDLQRSGALETQSPQGKLSEKWRLSGVSTRTSAIVANGTLLVGGGNTSGREGSRMYGVNVRTGQVRWEIPLKGTPLSDSMYSIPAVAGGTAFFGYAGNLHAVDVETGKEKWKRMLDQQMRIISSPAVANGEVYITAGGVLFAIDAVTGEELWTYKPSGKRLSLFLGEAQVTSSPALNRDMIFVKTEQHGETSSYGNLVAVDALTGAEKWSQEIKTGSKDSPVVSGSCVVVSALTNKLYCYDVMTGQERWNAPTAGSVRLPPVSWNGRLFYGDSKRIASLDTESGQEIWSKELGDTWLTPAIAGGRLFVGIDRDSDHEKRAMLYCIDPEDGSVLWQQDDILFGSRDSNSVPNAINNTPWIADGIFYLGGTAYQSRISLQ